MDKNSEENTETNAWKFVDLLFTGKYVTKEQNNNLVKLTKELKNNDIASVYIDNDIKDLITSAENKDNEDLKKRLETCYKSLNNNIPTSNVSAKLANAIFLSFFLYSNTRRFYFYLFIYFLLILSNLCFIILFS